MAEISDNIVDLSVKLPKDPIIKEKSTTPLTKIDNYEKETIRSLRPRKDVKKYSDEKDEDLTHTNGDQSESEEEKELPPIKKSKLSPAEVEKQQKYINRLKEDLRVEETKLVLLKKLKCQTQRFKENIAAESTTVSGGANICVPPHLLPPSGLQGLPSGLTITPAVVKNPLSKAFSQSSKPSNHKNEISVSLAHFNKQQPDYSSRNSSLKISSNLPMSNKHGGHASSKNAAYNIPSAINFSLTKSSSNSVDNFEKIKLPAIVKDLSPSITITPAPRHGNHMEAPKAHRETAEISVIPANHLMERTTQSPQIHNAHIQNAHSQEKSSHQPSLHQRQKDEAQRQAAAKTALRKQLEKTLLQIPPPKPPAPEMNFIPNPSNTDFVYLVGLEHVVDFLTKDPRPYSQALQPVECTQCSNDFTPMWKWDKTTPRTKAVNATFRFGLEGEGDEKVVCDACATNNVRKSLKTEHTNRLKAAIVKALQQEQEMEQRLTQVSDSPASSPVIVPEPSPSRSTHTPNRHMGTPPAPSPTPPQAVQSPKLHHHRQSTTQNSFTNAHLASLSQFAQLSQDKLDKFLLTQDKHQLFMNDKYHDKHHQSSQDKYHHSQDKYHQMQEKYMKLQDKHLQADKHHSSSDKYHSSQDKHHSNDKYHLSSQDKHHSTDKHHQSSQDKYNLSQLSKSSHDKYQYAQDKSRNLASSSGYQVDKHSKYASLLTQNRHQEHSRKITSEQEQDKHNRASGSSSHRDKSLRHHGSSSSSSSQVDKKSQQQNDKFQQSLQAVQSLQALQQQIFQGLSAAAATGAGASLVSHMLPFSPLFYPYMAMAQAQSTGTTPTSGTTSSKSASGAANQPPSFGQSLADLQRAADMQRQYLLEMIPPPASGSSSSGHNRHGNRKM